MKTANKREFIVDIVDSLTSTNSFIKDKIGSLRDGYTVRAITQTAGRGRFERRWVCGSKKDLAFSSLLILNEDEKRWLLNIPQIVAVSIYEVLDSYGIKSKIKWPNDILVNSQKIAGILVEGLFFNGEQSIIIGVGLNVNSEDFSIHDFSSTSLVLEIDKKSDIDELLNRILIRLSANFSILESRGVAPFVRLLNEQLAFLGERREVQVGDKLFDGTIIGVSDSGALLFKDIQGELHKFISGEISFRVS